MLPLWKRSIAVALMVVLAFTMLLPLDARAQGPKNGSLVVPVTTSAPAAPDAGGPFTGTFTINRFARQDGGIVALGTLALSRAGSPLIVQQAAVPVAFQGTATRQGAISAQAVGECNILTLVLGPLHLNLLGLEVDLNQVILTITGETGAGNLLGNLLCAIAGLLDPTGLPLGNALQQIINLLNQILAAL